MLMLLIAETVEVLNLWVLTFMGGVKIKLVLAASP
jgi:hypothetical protein